MSFWHIAILVGLLMVYGLTLYFAQSSIRRDVRKRRAYYIATYSLLLCFPISIWLSEWMALPTDLSMAIVLGSFALSSALLMSRILFVAIWTGRHLARGVIYDRQINPHMYALGVTAFSVLMFGSALLWFWAIARSLGWK
jgi:hypothetical protein